MTSPSKPTLEDIAKAADDIRTIRDFQDESLNDGFNPNLLSAKVVPQQQPKNSNYPLILLITCSLVLMAIITANHYSDLEKETRDFLLLLSIPPGIIIVICTNIKFDKTSVTVTTALGIILFISVAFGVITPKEASESARDYIQ